MNRFPLAVAAICVATHLAAASQQSAEEAGRSAGATLNPPRGQADAGDYKFTVHSNLVFLPTRVQDKRGETIYGLKPEQFIVEDNGVRQSVHVDEDPDTQGLSLVVAVQCSRSAPSEFNKLKGLGAMIDEITGDAPHEVAIVSYGEGPYVLGAFSSSSEAVRLALSRLKHCGDYGAASIDTVYYALNMLKRRQNHYRRAILLISETRDHGSRSQLHEVVAELGITDTVIYSVAFSPTRDEIIHGFRYGNQQPPAFTPPPPQTETSSSPLAEKEPIYTEHAPLFELPPQLLPIINALRRNTASELASLSGGEYANFTTQRGLEQNLEHISNQIHNYYLLSFEAKSAETSSLHSLSVRVVDSPDSVVQTRRNYWSGIFEPSSGQAR
ncbi:MAG: VWA domain-containing protein [Bryobacteraceae bacterium]|jgi:VWFA-related protein